MFCITCLFSNQGLEVSSKEVGVNNLETSDSGVGFNTALPLDTDTDGPDQISESTAITVSAAPETKPSPPPAAESKPSAPPVPTAETKVCPVPEKTPGIPEEAKLDVKPSPTLIPEPKAGLSPAGPKATTPTPEIKSALTPTPESTKPESITTPEPITNGTPEPGPDSKPSPDHADSIRSSIMKAAPPKTPELELKGSGTTVETSKEGTAAEESSTTT